MEEAHFYRIIQDSQDLGSDDEHMVSRIFFHLEVDGHLYRDLYSNIKQTVGDDFESEPSLEVSGPQGYDGPEINYNSFRNAVEQCFRSHVGSRGTGIRIAPGARVRMQNNIYDFSQRVLID